MLYNPNPFEYDGEENNLSFPDITPVRPRKYPDDSIL